MRKLFLLVLLFISVQSFSQVVQYPTNYGIGYRRVGGDTLLWCPIDTFSVPASLSSKSHLARKGTTLYYWNGSAWAAFVGGGSTDTTSLSNRINLKVNISDTSNMLNPYLRKVDTASKWVTSVYKKTASDSVFYVKGGSPTFAFKDSTGGSGTVPIDSLTGWALQFDYTKGHNVNHGYFWPETDSFYKFLNEAWVVPDSLSGGWTGYYVSAGYGGVHAFLGGMVSGSNGWYLTGNIYPGTGVLADYSWTGYDVLPNNTLHYVAVGYDGSKVVCYVDGVPSGKKAITGYRKGPNGSDPIWFTGGSDHSNYNGKILKIRHFEDDLPIDIGYWYYPRWDFQGSFPNTVFNSDYTIPANIIADHSPGFWGLKHPGYRNSIAPSQESLISNSVNSALDGRPDSLLPQWVKFKFQKPTYTGGSPTIPGSAVIYDSYMREDVTPAWNKSPSLDSTEGGTAGKKKYNFISSGSGILNKQAWLYRSGGGNNYLYVDAGISNQDIRVTQTIGDKMATIMGRWTDNNNYISVERSGTTMYIVKKVAGVVTNLDNYTTAVGYSELKLVISGGNWEVFEDGVSKKSGTSIGDVPLGTKCGWGVADGYTRVKKFEVY